MILHLGLHQGGQLAHLLNLLEKTQTQKHTHTQTDRQKHRHSYETSVTMREYVYLVRFNVCLNTLTMVEMSIGSLTFTIIDIFNLILIKLYGLNFVTGSASYGS